MVEIGYVSLGAPANMNFDPQVDQFTISIWFKPAAADNQRCILAKALMDPASGSDITVFLGIQTNSIYCLIGGGENTSGGDISNLQWHMATIVVRAGRAKLYLDKAQVGSEFSVGTHKNVTADWLIGASRYTNNTDDSYPFKGLLDEPTFWSVAFNDSQVAELYNSGVPIDPITHSKKASLLHWYRFGDDITNDTIPTIKDQRGSNNGTMTNMANVKLRKETPTFFPTSLSALPEDNGCDVHFNATTYAGSGNWFDSVNNLTGVLLGSNLPVKRQTVPFSGAYEVCNLSGSIMWRVANTLASLVTTTTTASYVMRINTGDEGGNGGFYLGYDGEGTRSDFQMYNLFYAEDAAARIRQSNNAADYLSAEAHVSAHPKKYVTVHAVIDMPNTRLKVYVNGGLISNVNTTSGTFLAASNAPLGIFGTAKVSTITGNASTALSQSIMEVARYQKLLSDNDIARQTAEFNALKGWF
jgi:hypothetical protein